MTHHTRSLCACGLALAVLISGTPTQAQNKGNYNNIIPGARPAFMGGAFTGLANDSSAAIHNPAGLALQSEGGLSLSVTAYGFESATINDALVFEDIPSFGVPELATSTTTDSLLLYPATLAWVYPLGQTESGFQHTAAFTVYVPSLSSVEVIQNLPVPVLGFYLDSYRSRELQEFRLGPSYAFQQSGSWGTLALGGSVFIQHMSFKFRSQESLSFLDFGFTVKDEELTVGNRLSSFEHTEGSYIGATGNLGLLYTTPSRRLSVGVNLDFPSARLTGTTTTYLSRSRSRAAFTAGGEFVEDFLDYDDEKSDPLLYQDVYRDIEGTSHLNKPWALSGGIAWVTDALTLTADVDLHFSLDAYSFIRGVEQPVFTPSFSEFTNDEENTTTRPFDGTSSAPAQTQVINYAVGADLQISETFSLLMGAFTDFSWVDDASLDTLSQVDMYGASLGLRRTTNEGVSNFGLVGRYGVGQAAPIDLTSAINEAAFNDTTSNADVTQWSVTLIIGGTTNFGLGDDEEKAPTSEAAMKASPSDAIEAPKVETTGDDKAPGAEAAASTSPPDAVEAPSTDTPEAAGEDEAPQAEAPQDEAPQDEASSGEGTLEAGAPPVGGPGLGAVGAAAGVLGAVDTPEAEAPDVEGDDKALQDDAPQDEAPAPTLTEAERLKARRAMLREARAAIARGDHAQAVEAAQEAKRLGAGSIADLLLAQSYRRLDKRPEAVRHYNLWLRSNRNHPLAPSARKRVRALGGEPIN